MNIFLTGGTGYVGAHILRALVADGHRVTVLARSVGRIPSLSRIPQVSLISGDLLDLASFRDRLLGHQVLIHNAIVWDDDPTELEMKDTRASAQLFELAAQSGIEQTIYTSTTAVHRPFSGSMTERDRLTPADYYGATKACGEIFLSAVSHQYPMRGNVVRLGPVVGAPAFADAPLRSPRLFQQFVESVRRGEDIYVRDGDGRQFTSAEFAGRFYCHLVNAKVNRHTFLCISDELVTWEEIAWMVIKRMGSPSRVLVEDGVCEQTIFDSSNLRAQIAESMDFRSSISSHVESLLSSERNAP